MIIERIIILIVLTVSVLILLAVLKRQQLKQAELVVSETINSIDSTQIQLIYFWSTQCGQCISMQTPIIDKLMATVGSDKLSVKKFNVIESPEQANIWGVKTVPSTYVLDSNGSVLHINNGLATNKKLLHQINAQ